jgi:hypothetical protein
MRSGARSRLRYPISLPERLVRASSAGVGGILLEGSVLLLPESVRRSQLYQVLLGRWLRVAVEYFGGVQGFQPADAVPAGNLMARKVTSNVVELTGIVAIGWSPIWVLAAAADLSNASRAYVQALGEELARAGLLPADAQPGSVDALLDALGRSTTDFARMADIPPLTASDVKATLRETRESLALLRASARGLPGREALDALAEQLQWTAEREGISMWRLGMLLGSGALQAGATVWRDNIVDHYRSSLQEIHEGDLPGYVRRVYRPYLVKTIDHLDPQRGSHTDRLIDRVSRRRPGSMRRAAVEVSVPADAVPADAPPGERPGEDALPSAGPGTPTPAIA